MRSVVKPRTHSEFGIPDSELPREDFCDCADYRLIVNEGVPTNPLTMVPDTLLTVAFAVP
jgi:hypothetical protein